MAKLRVGVIGAGSFACLRHLPDLLATGEVELAAVCRRDAAALALVAEHFGVPRRFADYREMLAEVPLDAALVSSPHALHAEHARAALERGLHVLTDKPLALTAAEARALRDLAAAGGRTLMVAFSLPFDPVYREAGRRIAAGELGSLQFAQAWAITNADAFGFFGRGAFPAGFPLLVPPTDFRAHPELGGGGYFQDVGNHLVAGLLVATGLRPVEVLATLDNAVLDMRAAVTIRCAGGALCSVTTMADAFPDEPELRSLNGAQFVGDRGSIAIDSSGALLQRWGRPAERVPADPAGAAPSPARNFVAVLRGRAAPLVSSDDAVATVQVVGAAYRSAREGRPVPVG